MQQQQQQQRGINLVFNTILLLVRTSVIWCPRGLLWSDASRFLSWALPARWDPCSSSFPKVVILIFFPFHRTHRSSPSLSSSSSSSLFLIFIFIAHVPSSLHTLRLSSPLALFLRILPSLLFTAASSVSSSIRFMCDRPLFVVGFLFGARAPFPLSLYVRVSLSFRLRSLSLSFPT